MLSLIQICITTVTPIPFTCSPGQSQIYFLSLWIYLFWTFHMTGIIQYVAFCNWLISFSIKFSRSIHVAASFRLSLLFFFFFSSTSLLLPTRDPPPSCTHAQSCNPMDCSQPGSSIHGLFQARILEWVAISFSRDFITFYVTVIFHCTSIPYFAYSLITWWSFGSLLLGYHE